MILSSLTADDVLITNSLNLNYLSPGLVEVNGSGLVQNSAIILESGSFTPTLQNISGMVSATPGNCYYSRNGSIVTFSFQIDVQNSLLNPSLEFDVPILPAAPLTSGQVVGSTTTYNAGLTAVGISSICITLIGTNRIRLTFPSLALGSWVVRGTMQYSL